MKNLQIKIILEGMPEEGGRVRADAFIRSLDSITSNIKKTDKLVTGSGASSFYLQLTELSYKSPATVVMEAIPNNQEIDFRKETITRFCSVYQDIQEGTIKDGEIDYSLIEALDETTKIIGKSISSIKIFTNGYDLNLNKEFRAKVEMALAPEERYLGRIRGMLEYINIHQDKNVFRIYPDIGPTKVTCHFKGDLTKSAIDAIGKFIEIHGELRRKAISIYPHEIIIDEIDVFPDEGALPSLKVIHGIAPDITGDISSEEFVRKIRNAYI